MRLSIKSVQCKLLLFFGFILIFYSCQPTVLSPCINTCKYDPINDCTEINSSTGEVKYFKCNEIVFKFDRNDFDCNNFGQLSIKNLSDIVNLYWTSGGILPDTSKANILFQSGDNDFCRSVSEKLVMQHIISSLEDYCQSNPVVCTNLNLPDVIKYSTRDTIKRCICDNKLWLYYNPDLSPVQIEETTAAVSNRSKAKGEGSSKNYIVYTDGDFPPNFAPTIYNMLVGILPPVPPAAAEAYRGYGELHPAIIDQEPIGPIVAFLDSGLDLRVFPPERYKSYPSLSDCFGVHDYFGWNFVEDSVVTYDDVGHGTLVAKSFRKVLDPANDDTTFPYHILPVKVLDSCGTGTIFSVACGMYYSQFKGADIINTSLGVYFSNEVLQIAVEELAQDIRIVASAGNVGEDLQDIEHYPSGFSAGNAPPDNIDFSQFKNVFEVTGLKLNYLENCVDLNQIDFWEGSNFNVNNMAENAIGYEGLIEEFMAQIGISYSSPCTSSGTSYAAPRISAALMKEYYKNNERFDFELWDSLNLVNENDLIKTYWSRLNCSQ